MFFFEETANHARLLLAAMQMTTTRVDHFHLAGRPTLAQCIGQAQARCIVGDKFLHGDGSMDRTSVDNR